MGFFFLEVTVYVADHTKQILKVDCPHLDSKLHLCKKLGEIVNVNTKSVLHHRLDEHSLGRLCHWKQQAVRRVKIKLVLLLCMDLERFICKKWTGTKWNDLGCLRSVTCCKGSINVVNYRSHYCSDLTQHFCHWHELDINWSDLKYIIKTKTSQTIPCSDKANTKFVDTIS